MQCANDTAWELYPFGSSHSGRLSFLPNRGQSNFDAVVNVEMLHYPRAISEKGDLLIPGRGLMMVGRMRHLKSGAVASPHVRDDISTNNMVL
jgi:hypothetical protein